MIKCEKWYICFSKSNSTRNMKVYNLGESNTVLNSFVAQMRDVNVQKDSMRFRRNLERLGEIFAYEISKTLNYSKKDYVTPLGIANISTPDDNIVVSTVLRAGLPLHQGILNYFDNPYTNAVLEGLNNVIQQIKTRARGFRNDKYFTTMIYLVCGEIDLESVLTFA